MTDDPVVQIDSGQTLNQEEFETLLRAKGTPPADIIVIGDYIDIQREVGLLPVPLSDLSHSAALSQFR